MNIKGRAKNHNESAGPWRQRGRLLKKKKKEWNGRSVFAYKVFVIIVVVTTAQSYYYTDDDVCAEDLVTPIEYIITVCAQDKIVYTEWSEWQNYVFIYVSPLPLPSPPPYIYFWFIVDVNWFFFFFFVCVWLYKENYICYRYNITNNTVYKYL